MSILPTWPIAAGALLVGLALGAYAEHTVMSGRIAKIEKAHADIERQRAEVYATDQVEARQKEHTWAARVGQVEQEKTNEIDRINTRHVAIVDGLRKRTERPSAPIGGVPEAPAACAGATGTELSRPDAEFLAGQAARAERQRAALAACYEAYDAVSK